MYRRQFLKTAGCFVASASAMSLFGCGGDDESPDQPSEGAGVVSFPQGVASGDPQENSVVLWTRALPKQGSDPVSLRLDVSDKEDFSNLIVKKMIEATTASDFTVRVFVEDLMPDRTYWYRFVAGTDKSRTGRTRTAPEQGADANVRFAWVSCQDYEANFYGAWRKLINDDKAAVASDQLHFVLFIGDFIYETRSAGFMQAVSDDLEPLELKSAKGVPRVVPEFPSGGKMRDDGVQYADSVDDYRHLYRTYLADLDLQDARARWPFVQVWDDHEFTDDCWQSQANYTRDDTSDEPSQRRRVAASQAWSEYVPAALSDVKPIGDVPRAAKDFQKVDVEDVHYDDVVVVNEPNNVKAIGAITLYRNFRWGKHLELVLTDNRSYRSDHAIAEQSTLKMLTIFDPRVGLPKDAVNAMDAGREANGGKPQDEVQKIPNTRKDQPPGSMLGAAQKTWWKAVMKASEASFKVWGNSVPLLRFLLDHTAVAGLLPNDLLLSDDSWDGFNTERKELLAFLKDNKIANVVSVSGDHHAHFAGVVNDDYDAATQTPVMVDFTAAGISSNSQWAAVAAVLSSAFEGPLADVVAPVKNLIVYDATALGGTDKAVVNLNTLIRYGSKSASVAAETNDLDQVRDARLDSVNPHLRYADSHAFGYGLASVSANEFKATLVSIERSYKDLGTESPKSLRSAAFKVARVDDPTKVSLDDPEITGKKPFPLA
jgi:alkaline phosphatase D